MISDNIFGPLFPKFAIFPAFIWLLFFPRSFANIQFFDMCLPKFMIFFFFPLSNRQYAVHCYCNFFLQSQKSQILTNDCRKKNCEFQQMIINQNLQFFLRPQKTTFQEINAKEFRISANDCQKIVNFGKW